MTREETVRSLREALDSVDITFPYRCAIVNAIEHLSIQEPEGLDEAAEKWCKENGKGFVLRDKSAYYIGETLPAFNAGAKWMAEQGVTLKVTDDTTWGEVNDFIHRNCDGAKEIQIRKKED